MKELSLHVLDIAQNSVRALAENIYIEINELVKENRLWIIIKDDGNGIDENLLKDIKDPFVTTRTTRKIGLGIPLLNQNCLQCNGELKIESEVGKGTIIKAYMEYNNIDRPPMGDIASTVVGLITSNINIHFIYKHKVDNREFTLDTIEINKILDGVPINTPEIYKWLKSYITENIQEIR